MAGGIDLSAAQDHARREAMMMARAQMNAQETTQITLLCANISINRDKLLNNETSTEDSVEIVEYAERILHSFLKRCWEANKAAEEAQAAKAAPPSA